LPNGASAVASFLPSMAALAAVTSYGERRFENLWVMVVLLLLLMGIWNYRNHTLQWLKKRIDYSDSVRTDNSQAVVLMVLAIGALAFLTPSISWRDIVEYLREDRQAENDVAEMLGIQEPHRVCICGRYPAAVITSGPFVERRLCKLRDRS
jgi:hypothetical protein